MFSNSYHLSIKVFSRRASSCAAALAYRVGIPLRDPYDGVRNYPQRRPGGIQSHFIMNWTAPGRSEGSAEIYQQILNEIGRTETRCNSRMFREFELGLPWEGTNKQRVLLTESFAGALSRGFNITTIAGNHEPPKVITSNHHCHLLALTRSVHCIDGQPRLGGKVRKLDARMTVSVIRRLWQKMLNRYYRNLGIDKTVSCESYETLGIDRIPTIHEGPGARIKNGERAQINDAIRERNNAISPGVDFPASVSSDTAKARKALEKKRVDLSRQIAAVEIQVRNKLKAAKLKPRQKKQASTLKQLVITAIAEGGSALDVSAYVKNEIGRGTQGKNAFYRLRKSLPPAGGDNEVHDARDGIELLALLFESPSDEALKKLRRWAGGKTRTVSANSVDLDDPFVLERLHDWEIQGDEESPPSPPAGSGDIQIG